MKIQLVQPSHNYINLSSSKYLAPYNLLRLATQIKSNIHGVELEILNQEHGSIDDKLNGDFIFFTANTYSYPNVLHLNEIAKSNGAITGIGGIHPTYLSHLVKKRGFDYVFIGDGDKVLLEIISGKKLTHNEFNNKARKEVDITDLPFPNRSLVDMEKYFSFNDLNNSHYPYKRIVLTYTHNSCNWQRCNYCCIPKKKYKQIMNPKLAVQEIKYLVENFNVDLIENGSDAFTYNKKWLIEFSNELNKLGINIPAMEIFVGSNEIDDEVALILKDINVVRTYIGYEVGSDYGLRIINKGSTSNKGITAAEILSKYGIDIFPFFFFGYPNETKEESNKTVEYANFLSNNFNVNYIGAYLLTPFPGSKFYRDLLKVEPKYNSIDLINMDEIRYDFIKQFCPESQEFYENQILKIKKRSVNASGINIKVYLSNILI
jgi:radical SAM superfamily enzyme YgiQ (UPF0313 family)